MLEFKTVKEALEFAISKEWAAVVFYEALASKVKDITARTTFEALAVEERKHLEILRLELIKEGFSVPEKIDPDQRLTLEIEIGRTPGEMTVHDAYSMAIQKERASFQLYAEMFVHMKTPEVRQAFIELAEEEMRHVLRFETEYKEIYPEKNNPHRND